MVVRSGQDRAVLIDAGPVPALVDGCLRRLGVHHLDLVLLTHHHGDHVLGLPGALHGRDVAQMLISPLAEPAENAALVRRWAAEARIPLAIGWAGSTGVAGMDGVAGESAQRQGWLVRWRLLAPRDPPATGAGNDGGDGTTVNESSLVTELDAESPAGPVQVLGLGDLETAGQQELAARIGSGLDPLGGPVDVVKVAHHGSARQDPALYRELGARVALIGVGAGNDYGHPAPSALAMLHAAQLSAFRTDLAGDLAVVPAADGALRVVTRR